MARKPPPPPAPTAELAQEEVREVQDESLTEQLSANRLEELYAKSGLRGQDAALETELKKWDQALKADVPVASNKEVKAYLVYFTTDRKQTMRTYLSRSTRYLPLIREIFQEHGLPEDLAYLAMIEIGFNPYAYSHAHASGMWQFIAGTGRRYGLEISNYVDERRDPVKATHAAAKYLLDLYKQFGSWYLAAASYNCGEGRVAREINTSNHKNFWELSANQCLPSETKNYVPQMIAATIIAKNPEKFGFVKVPYLPPIQFDTVNVNEATSLRAASIACNVPPEEMAMLNPELRKGTTPPGPFTLKIPKKSKEMFIKNINMARVEAPGQYSAPIETASNSYGSGYSRNGSYARKEPASQRETYSSREDPPARTVTKAAPRTTVKAPQGRSYQTAQPQKGKANTGRGAETSVHVASMLPGGKFSPATNTAGKGKAVGKTPETPAKKNNQKPAKKKSSEKTSSLGEKSKPTLTKGPAKGAETHKQADSRKKSRGVQTASKDRGSSS
ncbi:MAG: lytic transglycosylase domain-containing protein [Desulfobaccales bacterium]